MIAKRERENQNASIKAKQDIIEFRCSFLLEYDVHAHTSTINIYNKYLRCMIISEFDIIIQTFMMHVIIFLVNFNIFMQNILKS